MQKNFVLPMLAFFGCVGTLLLVNIDQQAVRNVLWQTQNSHVVSTTINWTPCIILLVAGTLLFGIGVKLTGRMETESMDIGGELSEPKHVDENGYIIAYRFYRIDTDNNLRSMHSDTLHPGGYLEADIKPTPQNTHGIYAVKSPDSPSLKPYKQFAAKERPVALVEVILWGDYVEGTKGYRAEHCQAKKIIKRYGG